MLPSEESDRRIAVLKEALYRAGMDCACIMHNVDRFYYTGTMQDGILVVSTKGDPVLFIRRTLSRAREESPIRDIRGYRSLREIREYVADSVIPHRRIGLDLDVVPAKFYLGFVSLFPDSSIEDVSSHIRRQRSIKSAYEQGLLLEAGKRFDHVLESMKEILRPGMSEYQAYLGFARLLLEHQSSLHIRTRMFNMEAETRYILSGESAAKLSAVDSPTAAGTGITPAFPSGAGMKKIRAGEPILIDSVFVYEGYQIDCTRIYAIGELDSLFRRAHDCSASCHELFRSSARPGTYIPDLYLQVWDLVEKRGFSEVFMGGLRFIGHGVGLELDEFPIITESYDDVIQKDMVIAFEPKFLFPGGTVGFENTYRVRGEGVESLSAMDEAIQYL
jgi:Xaa-Pro aminopeptidase